jgi:hypothetical protein
MLSQTNDAEITTARDEFGRLRQSSHISCH